MTQETGRLVSSDNTVLLQKRLGHPHQIAFSLSLDFIQTGAKGVPNNGHCSGVFGPDSSSFDCCFGRAFPAAL